MDNLLYIGGIAVAAASLLGAGVFFAVWKLRAAALKAQLNAEYGERKRVGGKCVLCGIGGNLWRKL